MVRPLKDREKTTIANKTIIQTNQPISQPTHFLTTFLYIVSFFKQPGHHRKSAVCSTERHIFSMSDDKEKNVFKASHCTLQLQNKKPYSNCRFTSIRFLLHDKERAITLQYTLYNNHPSTIYLYTKSITTPLLSKLH